MMRRLKKLTFALPLATANERFAIAFTAFAILLSSGCRYANNAPVTPLGGGAALQPLNPIQGGPSLSPIQPTSGISTFGAPTRVPPPPTGSYQTSINNPAAFNAGRNNYAPSNFQSSIPNQSNAYVGSGLANGTFGNGSPAGGSVGGGVRQAGWVSNNDSALSNGTSSSSGFSANGFSETSGSLGGFGTSGTGNQSAGTNSFGSPAGAATMRPRSGGMNVIDLTRAPSPPGYVPPQNRPGFQSQQFQSQTRFQNQPQFQNQTLGQPQNSTAPRNQFGPLPSTRPFNTPATNVPASQSQFLEARLPSTEPFRSAPSDTNGSNNSGLQWTRPSPRF